MAWHSKKDKLAYRQIGFTDEEWAELEQVAQDSDYVTRGRMVRDIVLLVCRHRLPDKNSAASLRAILKNAPNERDTMSTLMDMEREVRRVKSGMSRESFDELFLSGTQISSSPAQTDFNPSPNLGLMAEIAGMKVTEKWAKAKQMTANCGGSGPIYAAKFALDRELHHAGFDPKYDTLCYNEGRLGIERAGGRFEIIGNKLDPIKAALDKFFASV